MAIIGEDSSNPKEILIKRNLFYVKSLKYLDIPLNFTFQISLFFRTL